jgi:hypothetical protein
MANEANIIKIKRSGTSGAPASLKLGELAYSYLTASGNPTSNGGDRLFIGANGVNGGTGNANDVIVIGGKYFTDLLDHERGILTASSALIVDSNKKLDELLVDNLSLNGNTLSTTSGDLNVILSANGTGKVQINTSTNSFTLPGVRTTTTGYVLTANTDGTTSWAASASDFSLKAGTAGIDSGIDSTINLLTDDLEIRGDAEAISTALTSTTAGNNDHFVLTVSARYATTTAVGVASFNTDTFSVGEIGDVDIKAGGISNSQLAHSTTYLGSTLLTLGDTTGTTDDITGINSITASIGSGFTINADGEGNAWEFDATGNLTFPDGSYAGVPAGAGTFGFTTPVGTDFYINSGTLSWTFDQYGTLTLPSTGSIAEGAVTVGGNSVTTIEIAPATDSATDPNQKLVIYPTVTEGNHLHLTSGNLAVTDIFLGDDSQYIRTRSDGRMSIGTGVTDPELITSGYQWHFNTDGTTSFPNYTFPAADGNADDILITDGAGNLSWTQISTQLEVEADSGGPRTINLLDDIFRISGDGAISTALSVGTNVDGVTPEIITTISVDVADSETQGVASFNTSGFVVTAGDVALKGDVAQSFGGDTGTATPSNNLLNIEGTSAQGIVTSASGNTVTITADDASTTAKGVASFDTNNFVVTSGAVELQNDLVNIDSITGSTAGDVVINTASGVSWTFGTDGNLSAAGRITNVDDPTDAQDVATKAYVDATSSGLDVKNSVRAATTGNITLSNTQTIDGVALAVGNRVLVKDQTAGEDNGIYVVASGAWTRAEDFDNTPGSEVTAGAFTFVEEGNTNADSGWVLTTNNAITLGTTVLEFAQFSGAGQITAGDGLSKTGNRLDVNVANGIEISGDNVQLASTVAGDGLTYTSGVLDVVGTADRISVSSNAVDIASTYVGQSSITTVGTITTGTWQATTIASAYGGTGFTTYAKGDILYASATNTLSKLAAGNNGEVIQLQDGVPVWGVLDGGTY